MNKKYLSLLLLVCTSCHAAQMPSSNEQAVSQWFNAVKDEDVTKMRKILTSDSSVLNAINEDGATALMEAVILKDLPNKVFDFLISQDNLDLNVQTKGTWSHTALICAIINFHPILAYQLLAQKRIKVSSRCCQDSLLNGDKNYMTALDFIKMAKKVDENAYLPLEFMVTEKMKEEKKGIMKQKDMEVALIFTAFAKNLFEKKRYDHFKTICQLSLKLGEGYSGEFIQYKYIVLAEMNFCFGIYQDEVLNNRESGIKHLKEAIFYQEKRDDNRPSEIQEMRVILSTMESSKTSDSGCILM